MWAWCSPVMWSTARMHSYVCNSLTLTQERRRMSCTSVRFFFFFFPPLVCVHILERISKYHVRPKANLMQADEVSSSLTLSKIFTVESLLSLTLLSHSADINVGTQPWSVSLLLSLSLPSTELISVPCTSIYARTHAHNHTCVPCICVCCPCPCVTTSAFWEWCFNHHTKPPRKNADALFASHKRRQCFVCCSLIRFFSCSVFMPWRAMHEAKLQHNTHPSCRPARKTQNRTHDEMLLFLWTIACTRHPLRCKFLFFLRAEPCHSDTHKLVVIKRHLKSALR